jgi:hypothetical protein
MTVTEAYFVGMARGVSGWMPANPSPSWHVFSPFAIRVSAGSHISFENVLTPSQARPPLFFCERPP